MAALGQGGILFPLVDRIRKDRTLDFEIRSDEAHIYYRGGRLLHIQRNGKGFICGFDENYFQGNVSELKGPPWLISNENETQNLVRCFPELKQAMDLFLSSKNKSEREFQQLIVRENNYSPISNASDYFIVDIEYGASTNNDQNKKARFDLLAIKWESDSNLRQAAGLKKTPPKLAICELKYYTQALDGKAGLIDHIDDVVNFLSSADNVSVLKEDVLAMFQQKRELKLIEFGAGGNDNPVESLDDSIELILMLANYDPECTKLAKALSEIPSESGVDIKIAVANFLGYGLFKESVYGLAEFQDIFSKQIYCKA